MWTAGGVERNRQEIQRRDSRVQWEGRWAGSGWSERDQEEQSVRSLEERRQDKAQMEMSLKLAGDADHLRSRLKVTGSV